VAGQKAKIVQVAFSLFAFWADTSAGPQVTISNWKLMIKAGPMISR